MRADVVIVPGYTPKRVRGPIRLHPRARRRLLAGIATAHRLAAPWLLVSGGGVRPEGTSYVEAEEMAKAAQHLGWPRDRLLLDVLARHTTTNVRNAGRLMRDRGLRQGRIVTDLVHSLYLGFPQKSSFARRCRREIGHLPGVLSWVGPGQVDFVPNELVNQPGPDPRDP